MTTEEGKSLSSCSTCHWCHVMERESFESEEVAKIINDRFVSIKVDREERPDVDRVYVSIPLLLLQLDPSVLASGHSSL